MEKERASCGMDRKVQAGHDWVVAAVRHMKTEGWITHIFTGFFFDRDAVGNSVSR
jgi:hypothetical protein